MVDVTGVMGSTVEQGARLEPNATVWPRRVWLAPGLAPSRAAAWMALAEADPLAPLGVHPHMILATSDTSLSHVYADEVSSRISNLALLAPKIMTIGIRPGPSLKLRGHVMLENRLIGARDRSAYEIFVRRLRELLARDETAFCIFEDLDVASPLWTATHSNERVGVVYSGPETPHWHIGFPADKKQYWEQQFSSKTRNTLRRKAKKLAGEVHCYRTVADAPRFLEAARRVSANSWQMLRLGRGIRGAKNELERLRAAARLGALRSYVLECSGQPIAFVLGYQWKKTFVYESPAFDQAHSEASPGLVLLYRIIEHLIEDDSPERVDFGPGFHEYKEQFGNERSTDRTLFLVRPGGFAAHALAIDELRRRVGTGLRSHAKELLQRAGVWQTLRSYYRGQGPLRLRKTIAKRTEHQTDSSTAKSDTRAL